MGAFEEDVMKDLILKSQRDKNSSCQTQDLNIMCLLFLMKDWD